MAGSSCLSLPLLSLSWSPALPKFQFLCCSIRPKMVTVSHITINKMLHCFLLFTFSFFKAVPSLNSLQLPCRECRLFLARTLDKNMDKHKFVNIELTQCSPYEMPANKKWQSKHFSPTLHPVKCLSPIHEFFPLTGWFGSQKMVKLLFKCLKRLVFS